MKDYNHIEKLLERYYNAETSEQEEQELKDFFRHEEVPPHLLAEKEMFLQLQLEENYHLNQEFILERKENKIYFHNI